MGMSWPPSTWDLPIPRLCPSCRHGVHSLSRMGITHTVYKKNDWRYCLLPQYRITCTCGLKGPQSTDRVESVKLWDIFTEEWEQTHVRQMY